MKNSDNFNPLRDGAIKDHVAGYGETLNAWNEVMTLAAHTRLASKKTKCVAQLVDESIRMGFTVGGYEAPDFQQVCVRSRT